MKGKFVLVILVSVFSGVVAFQDLPQELIRYADTVFYNGHVLTVDDRFTVAPAVAVRDGRILAVGQSDRIMKLAGPKTVKVDLEGKKAVIPGVINTHVHPNRYAVSHYWSQLPEAEREIVRADVLRGQFQTKEEVLFKVKQIADGSTHPSRQWIRINWVVPRDAQRRDLRDPKADEIYQQMTKADLDKISPQKPLVIKRDRDAIVNSKGLEIFLQTYGNILDLKDDSGRFSGVYYNLLADEVLPHLSTEALAFAYKRELADWWASSGITTISTRIKAYEIAAYSLLDKRGELPVRMAYSHEIGRVNPFFKRDMERNLDNILDYGTDRVWMAGISVEVPDGSPYGDGSVCSSFPKIQILPHDRWPEGKCRWDGPGNPAREIALTLSGLGFRVAGTHMFGDKGYEMVLDTVLEGGKSKAVQMRTALDHGQMANPNMIKKAAALKAVWSAQVGKFYDTPSDLVESMYGKEVANKMLMPVKSMLDAGLTVSYESGGGGGWDDPNANRNPMFGMEIYVTRKNHSGMIRGDQERVDRKTALRILTQGGAAYVLREKELGSIEAGKLADLVVLDRNPLDPSIPDDKLSEIKVLMTVLGGKVVYDAAKFTPPPKEVREAQEYPDFFDRE